MLTVPAIACLANSLLGERAALWSTLLISISAIHVRYSQFVRVYALALFCLVIGAIFLVRFARGGKKGDAVAWLIAASLTAYLHYLGLLLVACLLLGVVFLARRNATFGKLCVSSVALLVLTAPAVYQLLVHFTTGMRMGWMKSSALTTFASIWYHLSSESTLLLVVLFSSVVFGGYSVLRSSERKDEVMLLFSWMLLPVAIIWIASLFGSSVFHVRYFIFVLPAFVLLASYGLSKLGPNVDVIWILPLVIVLSGNALSEYYFERHESARERAAYTFLNEHFQGGDVVLHTSKCSYVPGNFYAGKAREEYLLDTAPKSRTLRCIGIEDKRMSMADVASYNRLWLFHRDCYPRRASDEIYQSKEFKDLYPRLLYESPDGSLSLFDLTYREIYAGTGLDQG